MARMCMSTYTKEAQTNSACSHGEISRVPFKEFCPCLPSILLRQIECMMVLWVSCVFKAGMWVMCSQCQLWLTDGRECWHIAAERQVQETQEKRAGICWMWGKQRAGQVDLQTHVSRRELMRAGWNYRCVFTPDSLRRWRFTASSRADLIPESKKPADVARRLLNEAVMRHCVGSTVCRCCWKTWEENKHRKYFPVSFIWGNSRRNEWLLQTHITT